MIVHNITSPRTDDSAVEQEIKAKGLTAPRVTPADLEANIIDIHYFTAADGQHGADIAAIRSLYRDKIVSVGSVDAVGGLMYPDSPLNLLTFCVLVLKNGFTVTGESACASPENFDAEIGKKIALENAKQKIWPLMGYELKQRLAAQPARQDAAVALVGVEMDGAA